MTPVNSRIISTTNTMPITPDALTKYRFAMRVYGGRGEPDTFKQPFLLPYATAGFFKACSWFHKPSEEDCWRLTYVFMILLSVATVARNDSAAAAKAPASPPR